MDLKKYKLDYLAIFIIMACFYGYWQWGDFIGDPDGFYHAKIALFLSQGELLKSLPWMQYTTLNQNFTDHQLLYHLLLTPFVSIASTPLVGVKIATVFFASLMVTGFYWLLKQFKIRSAFVWTILFITLNAANFRLALIKTNSLSLFLIWLFIYALFRRQRWLLAILGLIFVWLYGGWPLAILIFGIYLAAEQIYNMLPKYNLRIFWQKIIRVFHKEKTWPINLQLFLYLTGGLIAGLIINPYWPHNLYFYYQQIIQIGIINYGQKFTVGTEWYGADFMTMAHNAPLIFILGLVFYVWLIIYYKKAQKLTWFSFILSFVFLILTLKSRRYMEYFMPFALFFIACAASDARTNQTSAYFKNFWQKSHIIIKSYLITALTVFVLLILPTMINRVFDNPMGKHLKFDTYAPAAAWLKNNTPIHSLVFHSDWDEWPLLFYHNDYNYYLVGLDPTFMHNFDSDLHQEYVDISSGQDTENISQKIQKDFGASYVFISKSRHQAFLNNIERDNDARLVYQDDETAIFQLK